KTPVKHSSPELKEMIAKVEEGMMEKFILREIPEEFQGVFFDRMKEGKDETIEGRLLEMADKLDQFYESFAELKRGNADPEFVKMYKIALRKLLNIPLEASVAYFRDTMLEDVMAEETVIDVKEITRRVLAQ